MSENIPINTTFHQIYRSPHYDKWKANRTERYFAYRKKWVDNPINFIDDGYPLNIDIETSSACNLKCPMCMRTLSLAHKREQEKGSAFFDFELYKRLVDEAAELGVPALKLNWMGEPLLHPCITDMVQYAKEKGIEDVQINTNAVLLSEDISRKLIKAGLDGLFFSFDSFDKEIYESIRVGAHYDEVLGNIKRFHEIRAELGSINPLTRIAMVRMPQNEQGLSVFVNEFSKIADTVVYYDLLDYTKDSSFIRDMTDKKFACSQLWQRMMIGVHGDIGVCCDDWDASFNIGNIKDTTIYDAWNSRQYKEIRALHKNMKWYQLDKCSTCQVVLTKQSGSVD